MKKILIILSLLWASAAYAQYDIEYCDRCKVYYTAPPRRVVKKVVRPVAVPVQQVVVPAPVVPMQQPVAVQYYPAGPGPISSTIAVPVPVPVAPPPIVCAWYIDPYDLFGQLFGNPDLVQSCW